MRDRAYYEPGTQGEEHRLLSWVRQRNEPQKIRRSAVFFIIEVVTMQREPCAAGTLGAIIKKERPGVTRTAFPLLLLGVCNGDFAQPNTTGPI